MSGDYSRHRYTPGNDYSGLWMQQGRVQLDADWNEFAELLDRRIRAESVDTFGVHPVPGITGVSMVSPQTPDAFLIDATGGQLTIGRGRMYVDGLLAENHGGGAVAFDRVMAELYGQAALNYTAQPYLPNPPALPTGGTHLAYLETWHREVTHLQQPELVEKALGVDTTTRIQTVWQVRLLANVGNVNCSTPDNQVPGWLNIVGPSAGRLGSRAVGVPPDQDPCDLPPSGGYRGLENQLYRIEIHDGGGVGQATFKWSRDNASVGSRVIEVVSATTLRLASLGRDAVLRFNSGDWVEILDDRRELTGESGNPAQRRGVMRKVTVDDATQRITFTPALPADLVPSGVGTDTAARRNLRVRRFDHKGVVRDDGGTVLVDLNAAASTGVIPVPAAGTWVTLENGVQVNFGLAPAGGTFRSGDYWVFAARTADASVEELLDAPPLGVHRHYARLAVVSFPDTETDCRPQWPPSCGGCCTITVAPGESIQAALVALPPEGGCVCLKTGVHEIEGPIEVQGSRIILRGEGPGAIVRGGETPVLLHVGGGQDRVTDILVDLIRFEATTGSADGNMIIYLDDCERVQITRCQMTFPGDQLMPHAGIYARNVAEVTIRGNRMENLSYGIWVSEFGPTLLIADNLLQGPLLSLFSERKNSSGFIGILAETEFRGPCRIERNRIGDFLSGIVVRDGAEGSVVAGNHVLRSAGDVEEPIPTDAVALRDYHDQRFYGIDIDARGCAVRGNEIDLRSNAWGGIRITASDAVVSGNLLTAEEPEGRRLLVPAGIYCAPGARQAGADRPAIRGNRLLGPQTGIVIVGLTGAVVAANRIEGRDAGWFGIRVVTCADSAVLDNVISAVFFGIHLSDGAHNAVRGNRVRSAGTGITGDHDNDPDVSDNSIGDCVALGILLYVDAGATLNNNRVEHCGYGSTSMGIGVFSEATLFETGAGTKIEGCSVLDTGVSLDGRITGTAALGLVGWVPALQATDNHVGYSAPPQLPPQEEHRAFVFMGPLQFRQNFGAGSVDSIFGHALVTGNVFHGPSPTRLVEFVGLELTENIRYRFEKVTFSNNVCTQFAGAPNDGHATVWLLGNHLLAMGNQVKGPQGLFSISLDNRNRVAVMGNITTGGFLNVGNVTPAPINNFNVLV